MKNTTITMVTLLAGLAAAPGRADECKHEADRQASIDVAGARSVRIEAGSGELRVEGRDGLARVEARGKACASDAAILEKIRISATRRGDVVVVKAEIPERASGWGWNERAMLDLVVEVPRNIGVEVHDGAGSAEIVRVGTLRIQDGSGELVITDVAGDLEVEDGSGSIEIKGVTGDVRVSDGSGSIDASDVGGSVTVDRDGSGSIDVASVRGDFTVSHDGSGGIAHRQVAGQVRIPNRKR